MSCSTSYSEIPCYFMRLVFIVRIMNREPAFHITSDYSILSCDDDLTGTENLAIDAIDLQTGRQVNHPIAPGKEIPSDRGKPAHETDALGVVTHGNNIYTRWIIRFYQWRIVRTGLSCDGKSGGIQEVVTV